MRVDAVGSCAGQTASSEASLAWTATGARAGCRRSSADDVVLALETPRLADARVSGPPPTNDTVTSSGTPSRAFFSALDAGARVSRTRRRHKNAAVF